MRKGRDGGKREKKEKKDENSGHYVIASRRLPERRQLEHRTLAPISKLSIRVIEELSLLKMGASKNQPAIFSMKISPSM